ncbi:hypothetical protein M434DRAFT_396227 [Hypoxylon sp. CO27-5]|nr:hypothetical protein M434DRAFT_396227 [Hypoxylon sp. CO27-5]
MPAEPLYLCRLSNIPPSLRSNTISCGIVTLLITSWNIDNNPTLPYLRRHAEPRLIPLCTMPTDALSVLCTSSRQLAPLIQKPREALVAF